MKTIITAVRDEGEKLLLERGLNPQPCAPSVDLQSDSSGSSFPAFQRPGKVAV
jgi:hypothetical protein